MFDPDNNFSLEEIRPKLIGLAYRMLGSVADAEDAVQDTFVKWSLTDQQTVKNPGGWMVTACTRRCIDMLRSAQRTRIDYVGAWLPEPTQTTSMSDASDSDLELSGSLTTAFLLMLERLTARERAAFVLHDVFEAPYSDIAQILNMKEATCRKLVSRAKSHISHNKVRSMVSLDRQEALLNAFRAAVSTGATQHLARLLADDVMLSADGGGKAPAVLDALQGKNVVLEFISSRLKSYWERLDCVACEVNGARGFAIDEESNIHATVSFSYDDAGKVSGIYIMRNPEKLSRFRSVTVE
ncbi:MAG: RNA polymerase sigma factor SigJ [Pseudomonadota bacterium]